MNALFCLSAMVVKMALYTHKNCIIYLIKRWFTLSWYLLSCSGRRVPAWRKLIRLVDQPVTTNHLRVFRYQPRSAALVQCHVYLTSYASSLTRICFRAVNKFHRRQWNSMWHLESGGVCVCVEGGGGGGWGDEERETYMSYWISHWNRLFITK